VAEHTAALLLARKKDALVMCEKTHRVPSTEEIAIEGVVIEEIVHGVRYMEEVVKIEIDKVSWSKQRDVGLSSAPGSSKWCRSALKPRRTLRALSIRGFDLNDEPQSSLMPCHLRHILLSSLFCQAVNGLFLGRLDLPMLRMDHGASCSDCSCLSV